jgi:hypothetical protein
MIPLKRRFDTRIGFDWLCFHGPSNREKML